jgi:hypothetical protein
MQHWQYAYRSTFASAMTDEVLAEWGDKGWELAGFSSTVAPTKVYDATRNANVEDYITTFHYIFKRPRHD